MIIYYRPHPLVIQLTSFEGSYLIDLKSKVFYNNDLFRMCRNFVTYLDFFWIWIISINLCLDLFQQ
jgi:hypothetical protein